MDDYVWVKTGKQQCLLLWLCMGNKQGNNSAYYYGYVWVTNGEITVPIIMAMYG